MSTDPLHPSPRHAVVHARDGFPLAARVYSPPSEARATLLVHSATASPQGYYARFAAYAAARGVRTLTYDYRGVGGSRPGSLRALDARMSDWAELDAAAIAAWVSERWEGPRVALGHSFGGQLLGLVDEASDVDAVVLVAAQLGFFGHWPARQQLRLKLMWYGLVPALTGTVGFFPAWGGRGEELPAGVAREWAKWCRSPGYYLDHVPGARARLASFDRPVLAFSFDDDDFGPRAAVDALLRQLRAASIDHRHLSPGALGQKRVGHFGFFRPALEEPLWADTLRFVESIALARAAAAA